MVGLHRQHADLQADLSRAVADVISSDAFVLGTEVERFEAEFAAYCGVRDCVGVGSGTAALTIALVAAGIGAGDEVIVPAHTFIGSALGVVHAGATPVFCDVEDATGLIDVDSAAAAVGDRTAAVIPVHLYGQCCDMDALQALAGRHGLLVLEDAAQAHGASYRGRRAGSMGDLAAFSFYPSKNLGAMGDGGAICTDDAGLADLCRELRDVGRNTTGEHIRIGFNERLDGLQAAILRVKLHRLDEWNARRRAHARAYRLALEDSLRLLDIDERGSCVYHLFPIRVQDRDRLAADLMSAGVQTRVHYSPALPDQPPLASLPSRVPLDVARTWASEELSLPMFAELETDEVQRVAALCRLSLAQPHHDERPVLRV